MFTMIVFSTCYGLMFSNGLQSNNIARGRQTLSSSGTAIKARAVDGNKDPRWSGSSCWETGVGDMNPYWMVDLENEYYIHSVAVTNRGDCCDTRLHDIEIEVYTENPIQVSGAQRSLCSFYKGPVAAGATETIRCYQSATGRFVKINGLNRQSADDRFTLCEAEVYSALGPCFTSSFVRQESTRHSGTGVTQTNTTRSECSSSCFHLFSCTGFNYNSEGLLCEMVAVQGTTSSEIGWEYFNMYIDQ